MRLGANRAKEQGSQTASIEREVGRSPEATHRSRRTTTSRFTVDCGASGGNKELVDALVLICEEEPMVMLSDGNKMTDIINLVLKPTYGSQLNISKRVAKQKSTEEMILEWHKRMYS